MSAGELSDEKSFASAPSNLFSFSGFCMDRTSILISLHFIKISSLQAIYNFTFLVTIKFETMLEFVSLLPIFYHKSPIFCGSELNDTVFYYHK